MSAATPVAVFRLLAEAEPVFHAIGPRGLGELERQDYDTADGQRRRALRTRTRCGRLAWELDYVIANHRLGDLTHDRSPATLLRHDHAELIGRPCRRCWPDELPPPASSPQ